MSDRNLWEVPVPPEVFDLAAAGLLLPETTEGIDVTADEVLGNIKAMTWAVDTLARAKAVTVDGLRTIHEQLRADTRLSEHAGRLRSEQNWIGGSSFNPCSAAFVPPPPDYVADLLDDLCTFVNDDSLPAVAQAAIAHAQFETIHPFIDGNGRTGRALVHTIFRRRGIAPRVLPPVSLVLASWSTSYVDGLTATRYRGGPTSSAAHDSVNHWVALFAAACNGATGDATDFEAKVERIHERWRGTLGRVRAGSAIERLLPGNTQRDRLAFLRTQPHSRHRSSVVATSAGHHDRPVATTGGLRRGIQRNRAFEAPAIIDAFAALERRLANARGTVH